MTSAARLDLHDEVHEAKEISDFLHEHSFPSLVKGFDLELGEDWAGEPTAYVWLLLDKDLKYGSSEMNGLSEFAQQLRMSLLRWPLRRWPYVSFRVRRKQSSSSDARQGEPT